MRAPVCRAAAQSGGYYACRLCNRPLVVYGAASLAHFIHNAEFLHDYPGLSQTWTRGGVYGVWLAMTATGVAGWLLVAHRQQVFGLLMLAAYAAVGLDSLGHYVLAPLSAHTMAMNATIFLEVTAAALVLVEVARQLAGRALRGPTHSHEAP